MIHPPRPPAAAGGRHPVAEALATVEGLTLRAAEPLAPRTTLRIGGPAELLAEVRAEEALGRLVIEVARCREPFAILGLGSNVLVPDEGLSGVVAVLGGELARLRFDGEQVEAGAGVPLARLARRAAARGLLGLEALAGFPSTVGGAVVMNAGCYGTEIVDVLDSVSVIERDGRRRRLTVADLAAGYRTTALQGSGSIVTGAVFRLVAGDAAAGLARIRELNLRRRESLPSGLRNAGSIFKNPAGDHAGRLIDACGLKGLRRGGAEISRRHANVIVNRGAARAADVLALMMEASGAVAARFGVHLEPEIVLCGDLARRWSEANAAAGPVPS